MKNFISTRSNKNTGNWIKKALFLIALSMVFLLFSVQQSAALVYEISGNFGEEIRLNSTTNPPATGDYVNSLINGSFYGTYSLSSVPEPQNWPAIDAFSIGFYDKDSNLKYTISSELEDYVGIYFRDFYSGYDVLQFGKDASEFDSFLMLSFAPDFVGVGDIVTNASITGQYNIQTGQAQELLNIVDGNSNVAPVPEPATMLLLGTGLFGFAGFRKRFKK